MYGFFYRAIGRDFPDVASAEGYARDYMAQNADVGSVRLFIVGPESNIAPAHLWHIYPLATFRV